MNSYITETRLLNLSSEFATYKNNTTFLSDVTFDVNGLLVSDDNIVDVNVSLVHAEIPVSFYVINYTNNVFTYTISAIQTNLNIPVGNYNVTTLFTYLQANTPFTFIFNKINGLVTITHPSANFIITGNAFGVILGFQSGSTNNSILFNLTGNFPINLLGIKKLNIVSNELITHNFTAGKGFNSLLASLAVDQPAYGLIVFENKSNVKHSIQLKELNKIDIQITDEKNNLINFNNIDWSLLIAVYITKIKNNLDLPNLLLKNSLIAPFSEEKLPEKKIGENNLENDNLDPELKFLTE